jgi:tetratricopeptide (TPR) repeat protein
MRQIIVCLTEMLQRENMKKVLISVLLVMLAACSRDPMVQRDKYFARAQKYVENKKFEEAAIEFRNALKMDKGHIPSYLGIARAFQQLGDIQNALATYQQVLQLDGKNVTAKLELGKYFASVGLQKPEVFEQSKRIAQEVLQIESSNIDALILLGTSYMGQKEADKAIAQFERVLSIDPGNMKATLDLAAAHFLNKDVVKAESAFKTALQQHPDEITAYLAIAAFYSSTQRPQETEIYLKKAFELAPSDERSLYSLTSFYLSNKKEAEAEKIYKEAIVRKPQERIPRWGLASFYLQQNKTDLCIGTLQELLKINKKDRGALLLLAEIYLKKNDLANAQENIKLMLNTDVKDPQAHHLQGKLFRIGGEFDKAIVEFDNAIKADPSLLPAYLEKANLQLRRGEWEACNTTLQAVLRINRNYVPAMGAYAKLLAIRNHPQEALQQADGVLAVMPNNEDAVFARADALRLLGRLGESKAAWTKLNLLKPDNFLYWYRMGGVEASAGNKPLALANFRKALELNPGNLNILNDILYLHIRDKQFDAALAELDRLSKTSVPQDEIHRFRGQVLLDKGDIAGGEAELLKATQINSKNYQSYMLFAQLNVKKNNIAQAIKQVDRLISMNDKYAPAYLQKAYYLEISKDIPGAMTNYKNALALDSENAVAANNLAWLLCESNTNLNESLALARTAKKQLPQDPEVAETLGWIYYKMKNYTLALDQLLMSIENRKQPKGENFYRLGMVYYAKGDLVAAKQVLKKSLEISGNYPGSQEARKIISQN